MLLVTLSKNINFNYLDIKKKTNLKISFCKNFEKRIMKIECEYKFNIQEIFRRNFIVCINYI